MVTEEERDRQVARETVRHPSDCPHCNPRREPGDRALPLKDDETLCASALPVPADTILDYIPHVQDRNQQRGLFAGVGVAAYAKRVGTADQEDLRTSISDLLGDLRHLCDAAGLDFDDLDYRGQRHYEEEIGGEG